MPPKHHSPESSKVSSTSVPLPGSYECSQTQVSSQAASHVSECNISERLAQTGVFRSRDESSFADRDTIDETILALDLRARDTVGAAYYSTQSTKLFLLSDAKLGGLSAIEQLKTYVLPTIILAPGRIDERVIEKLDPARDRQLRSVNANDEDGSREVSESHWADPWVLEIRPSNEFAVDGGKAKLASLNLSTTANSHMLTEFVVPEDGDSAGNLGFGFTNRQDKMLKLARTIDLDSELSIGCANAVLTYLRKRRAVGWAPEENTIEDHRNSSDWKVTALEMFSLEGTMFLDSNTLTSLSIFQSECHPNSHNQGPSKSSGAKEDLSVYGLFHFLAKTPQGKYLLRQQFLRPSLDLDIIVERHRFIDVLLLPENETCLSSFVKSLKSIKNMRNVMIRLRKGMSNGMSKTGGIRNGIWMSLRSFAFYALEIRAICTDLADGRDLQIMRKIMDNFGERDLKSIGRFVTETIDFGISVEVQRAVVVSGYDEQLDEMKRLYDGIEDLLGEASRRIADSIPQRYGLNLNVVFFPQIGFLICMPADPQTGRAEWEGGDDEGGIWERIFSTPERVYYKDTRMKELDLNLGDVYANICDREIDILYALGQKVLEYEQVLCTISDICGELDSLLALAQGAKLYKLTKPKMTHENILDIQEGHHILQELTTPACISNNTNLAGGRTPRNLINHSEDTKHVPNSQTTSINGTENVSMLNDGFSSDQDTSILILTGPNYSGLTDKILTRITTMETVTKAQSAFMIDLHQIASAIHLATMQSLLIIDEFGKGTNTSDGAGLVCGLFEYFLSLGSDCPKVLAATHFHEIFENGFLGDQPGLAFGHMEVKINKRATDTAEQVTYLYRLTPGRSTSSFGTLCASLNGVDQAVVDRAQDLIILAAGGDDLVVACASISNDEMAHLQAAVSRDWKKVKIMLETNVRQEGTARRLLECSLTQPVSHTGIDPRSLLESIVGGT